MTSFIVLRSELILSDGVVFVIKSNKFWNIVSGFLSKPSDEEKECHSPKPILLNVGDVAFPYPWDPSIVPISIFKVGQLIILNVPAEFTTMAGRRLRKAITKLASKYMLSNVHVTIAGLANSYSHYVTTFEEYAAQRYEGASTLYGPHTLSAYIQEFERLAEDLFLSRNSSDDSQPPDLSKDQISLLPPVIVDTIAIGKKVRNLAVNMSYVQCFNEIFISRQIISSDQSSEIQSSNI